MGEDETAPGETPAPYSFEQRVTGGCVAVLVGGILIGVAATVPETAYFAAGLMASFLWRKASGLLPAKWRRKGGDWEEPDVLGTLWELSESGTQNVRLKPLADALGLPDTRLVRQVLEETGVPIREGGVRSGRSNGPGVHREDLTPPPPWADPLSQPVTSDNDSDDTSSEGAEEGMSILIERPNDALTIYRDPAETIARRSFVARKK